MTAAGQFLQNRSVIEPFWVKLIIGKEKQPYLYMFQSKCIKNGFSVHIGRCGADDAA